MRKLLVLLTFFFLSGLSFAQVSVKLQQPPPYQFKVEQFWKITLINSGSKSVNVYLKGIATESLEGKIIEATSSVITLQPGLRTLSGRDLGPLSVSESNNRYKNIITNTGGLPSGNYEICVSVLAALDGSQIAADCIQVSVENFNRMELVSPLDHEVLGGILSDEKGYRKNKTTRVPQTIIFSWLPPVPIPPGAKIGYRLKLVEIFGNQSVHSAMASNPKHYQSLKLSSTILRYPIAAKPLMPGGKYAWSVDAFIDDFKIQESEIRSFEIQGGDKRNEKNLPNNDGDSRQYNENYINDMSGLPSGLSSFKNNNHSTSSVNFIRGSAPIDILGSPTNLKFTGDAKFTHISTRKKSQFSELPLSYQTLEINPRISIFDIPFGVDILLSSLDNPNRQSMNSFTFMLDIDRLNLKMKDFMNEKIREAGSSSDSTYSESLIKTFGIGRTYPEYSEFTGSGVPVNGINVEISPGIFYLAFAAGNNTEGFDDISFSRSFISARIGLGQKENTHFYLTGLKMKDDPNSIQVSADNFFLTPQEDVVIGSEGKLSLFQKMIEIDGEAAASVFTRNSTDADVVGSSIPDFLGKILTPKVSTSFDYAWKGNLIFNNSPSATYFSLGVKRVGPGFISLGAPNVKQDQLQYDINLDQKFIDDKITMKTFYRVYNDNLIDWKQCTTTTSSYGVNLGFYFPDIPFFQINYSPYLQKDNNAVVEEKIENGLELFSLTTGYSYGFFNSTASTTLSFTGQWQSSMAGITESKTSNKSYTLNQNLSFEFPLSLSLSLSTSQSKIYDATSNVTDFDLNGNYQLSEMISANLGGTISKEENYTKKTVIYFGSNISLSQWLRFELQGNISNYQDLSGGDNSYSDSMVQATVLINW
ncbi:MAG: hypothetical protein Q8S39_04015 [Ignavibacteria bacterium]|nr:hypothetical protein [Ignavibacteria bacterium]